MLGPYEIFVRDNYGLAGNHVLLKCDVPFNPFVTVDGWIVFGPSAVDHYVDVGNLAGTAACVLRLTFKKSLP